MEMEIAQKRVRSRFKRTAKKVASTILTASGSVTLKLFGGIPYRRPRRDMFYFKRVAI